MSCFVCVRVTFSFFLSFPSFLFPFLCLFLFSFWQMVPDLSLPSFHATMPASITRQNTNRIVSIFNMHACTNMHTYTADTVLSNIHVYTSSHTFTEAWFLLSSSTSLSLCFSFSAICSTTIFSHSL